MGAACSCFTVHDTPANEDGHHHRDGNCRCFICSFQNIIDKCRAVFRSQSGVTVPMSNQGVVSSDLLPVLSTSNFTNESSDRSLPSNANSGFSIVPQEDEIRIQRVSSHSRAEPASFRNAGAEVTPKERIAKLVDSCEKESEKCCPESSMSFLSSKVERPSCYCGYSSSEDEDVCPTCLEEYTPENPKIVTKCSHHYHLSCIYEWLERSETCPVCGRIMLFDDTN